MHVLTQTVPVEQYGQNENVHIQKNGVFEVILST